jgi:hypothetical protein
MLRTCNQPTDDLSESWSLPAVTEASSPRFTRAVDCIKPKGPLGRATFYRRVQSGDIELEHLGPRITFVRFATPDDLIADLIEKDRQRRAALDAAE